MASKPFLLSLPICLLVLQALPVSALGFGDEFFETSLNYSDMTQRFFLIDFDTTGALYAPGGTDTSLYFLYREDTTGTVERTRESYMRLRWNTTTRKDIRTFRFQSDFQGGDRSLSHDLQGNLEWRDSLRTLRLTAQTDGRWYHYNPDSLYSSSLDAALTAQAIRKWSSGAELGGKFWFERHWLERPTPYQPASWSVNLEASPRMTWDWTDEISLRLRWTRQNVPDSAALGYTNLQSELGCSFYSSSGSNLWWTGLGELRYYGFDDQLRDYTSFRTMLTGTWAWSSYWALTGDLSGDYYRYHRKIAPYRDNLFWDSRMGIRWSPGFLWQFTLGPEFGGYALLNTKDNSDAYREAGLRLDAEILGSDWGTWTANLALKRRNYPNAAADSLVTYTPYWNVDVGLMGSATLWGTLSLDMLLDWSSDRHANSNENTQFQTVTLGLTYRFW